MNTKELSEELKKLGIPNSWFQIGEKGNPDNKDVLRLVDNQWSVYYSERGGQFDLKTFKTEDEACSELLLRMKAEKEEDEQLLQDVAPLGKTDSIVLNHLLTEEKVTEKVALQIIGKLDKHPDILEEFTKWVQTRQYPVRGAICVEGYTAQKLSESTHLHPVGAYNYLIYLREKPEEALNRLKQGLPIK
jgi:hypothetical protein